MSLTILKVKANFHLKVSLNINLKSNNKQSLLILINFFDLSPKIFLGVKFENQRLLEIMKYGKNISQRLASKKHWLSKNHFGV